MSADLAQKSPGPGVITDHQLCKYLDLKRARDLLPMLKDGKHFHIFFWLAANSTSGSSPSGPGRSSWVMMLKSATEGWGLRPV
jgi:hypothetical protein